MFLPILSTIKIEQSLFLKVLKKLAFFDSSNKSREKINATFVIRAIIASIWNVFIKFRWHDEKLTRACFPHPQLLEDQLILISPNFYISSNFIWTSFIWFERPKGQWKCLGNITPRKVVFLTLNIFAGCCLALLPHKSIMPQEWDFRPR